MSIEGFSKDENERYVRIACPADLNAALAQQFLEQAKAWMLSSAEKFILDLDGVEKVSREFYKAVIQLKTNLKRDGKTVLSVNVSSALLRQFKDDGVELAFNPSGSLKEAIGEPEKKGGGTLNVEFLNPFLSGTQKALEIQCNTKIKAGKPSLKRDPAVDVGIAGVLTLISNGFAGSIVLCFPEVVFLKIYERMFDEKHEHITPEIEDAAGELLNIIYGMAKIELNTKGYDFQKALPTVLVGKKLAVRQSGSKPAVTIPFESDAGNFHIEIQFDKTWEDNHV